MKEQKNTSIISNTLTIEMFCGVCIHILWVPYDVYINILWVPYGVYIYILWVCYDVYVYIL